MAMAQAIRTRIRSAPFDFDFRKLNIEAAQRRVGDILGTPRISNRDSPLPRTPIAEPNVPCIGVFFFCGALSPGRLKVLDALISMNLIQLSAWL